MRAVCSTVTMHSLSLTRYVFYYFFYSFIVSAATIYCTPTTTGPGTLHSTLCRSTRYQPSCGGFIKNHHPEWRKCHSRASIAVYAGRENVHTVNNRWQARCSTAVIFTNSSLLAGAHLSSDRSSSNISLYAASECVRLSAICIIL